MTAGEAPAALPGLVGVVGGGRMGAGIAHAFLVGGSRVVVVDADEAGLAAAHERVAAGVRRTEEKGLLPEPARTVLERLDARLGLDAVAGCDLVVEAVPEDPELKGRVLASVAGSLGPDAVLATNTSSLSVTELAEHVADPARFVGLHFFNPVPASELVEVVVGRSTSEHVVRRARAWTEALGKTPVTVADSPGFATSRLGVALGLEAIRMLEEGVAPAEDIDAAMSLGYKHPVGPLRLTDLVGLDVRLGVADYLAERLGPRFEAPTLLRDKVARGELGRKTGEGFYRW